MWEAAETWLRYPENIRELGHTTIIIIIIIIIVINLIIIIIIIIITVMYKYYKANFINRLDIFSYTITELERR